MSLDSTGTSSSQAQDDAGPRERSSASDVQGRWNRSQNDDGEGQGQFAAKTSLRDASAGSVGNFNGGSESSKAVPLKTAQIAAPTASITATDQSELMAWPGEALSIYKKIAKLQHKFFGTHVRLISERDAIAPKLDNLNESLSRLGRLLEELADNKMHGPERTLWTDAYDQFTADQQSFKDQIRTVHERERRLGKNLYKLAKLEPKLFQLVDAYFKTGAQVQHESSTSTSSRSYSPTEALDPLEQQYYSKRGDVRLLRERLINQRADFAASSAENFLVSPVEGQYPQNHAFRNFRETKQQKLLEELSVAEEQMKALWHQCQNAQLDVGDLEVEQFENADTLAQTRKLERRESDPLDISAPSFLPDDWHELLPEFLRDIRWSSRRERIAPFVEELARFTGKREFIEDWVGKIPLGKAVPPDPVEFEHVVTSAKSEPEWAYVDWADDDVGLITDYILVPNEGENAPNGDSLLPRPSGLVHRVLRRVWSDGALEASSRLHSVSSNLDSRKLYRNPHQY